MQAEQHAYRKLGQLEVSRIGLGATGMSHGYTGVRKRGHP
jgi:hypothetical protein